MKERKITLRNGQERTIQECACCETELVILTENEKGGLCGNCDDIREDIRRGGRGK